MRIKTFIFEDDPGIRHLLQLTAAHRGHEVSCFSTPLEWDQFSPSSEIESPPSHFPDIVLTDFDMPGANGLELLGFLASTKKSILWAVITAKESAAIREEAKTLGAVIFSKPFRLEVVDQWLQECEDRIAKIDRYV